MSHSSGTKVPLISAARHFYGGRWLHKGDPFLADNQRDADELLSKAIRFARLPNPGEFPEHMLPTYGRRDMQAVTAQRAPEPAEEIETEELEAEADEDELLSVDPAPKTTPTRPMNRSLRRQLNRRDMNAKK